MKFKKIIALVVSSTLIFTYFNTLTFAKTINLDLNKIIIDENKQQINPLENNIIQVNDLLGELFKVNTIYTTLDSGILKIGFDEKNKKLKVFDVKNTYFSTLTKKRPYFVLKVLNPSWQVKKEITFLGDDIAGGEKRYAINSFNYNYGDILSLWASLPQTINIHGKISALEEDYPYIMPNTSTAYNFEITKEGLKPVHIPSRLNESLSNNSIEVRSEFWQLSTYMKWLLYSTNGFKINFDENLKQLKVVNRSDDYYLHKSIGYGKYFTIIILDKQKKEKLKVELNGYDTGKSSKLDVLNNFKYEYGDIIKLWCDSPNEQRILGKVLEATSDYSKGMEKIENLEEIAFEITPKGLKEISNRPPEIIGAEDIIIRKGTPFNKMENITAKDDNDGDVTRNLTVIGDVNINRVGVYNLTYRVSDSKNKITEKIRKVNVVEIPKLERNKIKVLGLGNDEKFKIEFDDLEKKLKIKDRENSQIHSYFNNRKYFSFYLLDKNYREKLNINLNGDDLGTSSKLNQLENFKYEYGDFIKLYHAEPGRLKITGDIIDKREDYSDGVGNRDNIDNAYFQITAEGLKSIYNEAPIISGINNVTLKVGDSFNPLEGINITDDYDKNLVPTIKGNVDTNTAGNYSLTYTARDSMGRAVSSTRNIIVRTNEKPTLIGIDDVTIKAKDNFNKLLGVAANDKEDGDLTSKIKVAGNLDVNTPGIYKLNYSVEDSDGNITNEIRLINVRSNEKPVINGANNLTIKVNDEFNPLEGITASDNEDLDLTNAIKLKGTVDKTKVGTYDLIYSVKDNDNNETIATRRVTVRSNETPVINGTDNRIIKIGDTFNSLEGVGATDFEDKDLSNKISVTGNVNNNTLGDYKLTYSVTDSDGNIKTKDRIITVRTNNKPKFFDIEDITILVGEDFDKFLGVSALDREDGDISNKIKITGNVDNNRIGTYELVYSIEDSDKNQSIVRRLVTVRSNEKPVINTTKLVSIKVNEKFDPLEGVTVTDKEDGDLKTSLVVKGNVNTNLINEYDLIYSVTDRDNNTTLFKRKVVVKSNEKPLITGAKDTVIKVGETLDLLNGILVYDKEDGDITKKLIVEGNVDNSTVGIYNIFYSVIDSDGNKLKIRRIVTVRSNEKPVITGADAVTIKAYDTFNENLAVTAQDKEDGDLTSKINITGNVDTSTEGVYTLVYSVTDSDGNNTSVRRRVKVRSNHKPEIIGASEVILKVGNTFDPLQGIVGKDGEDGDITKNILVIGDVDMSKVGHYNLKYSITDSDGNTTAAERKVIVESNEKPIISGTENKVIKIGDDFNPLEGVIANDFEDKDITNKILVTGSVNTNIVGDYKLTYSVIDSDGNKITTERVITVRTNEKPKILGLEDTIIKVGDNFENTSLAVLSMDEEDGDLTKLISIKGKVDNSKVGEYKLIYSVIDSDGNTTTAERKVTVRSNEKPVITGIDAITIKAYDTFNESLGVIATDKEDGDLTSKINTEGNVDSTTEGVYTLVYSVKDSDGNHSSVRRRVKVRSNHKPEIIGASEVILKLGNTFNTLQGVLARDFEDGDITKNISVTGIVDTLKIGEYKIQYAITDSDGNTTTAERKVKVESNEKPKINGTENKVIKIGDDFNPLEGVMATDFEDKDLTDKISVTGSVNNNLVGDYKLTYSVIDSDGNAITTERVITVRTNTKPKILGVEDIVIKVGDNFENTSLVLLAIDEEDGDLTKLISIKGKVDNSKVGEYKLTYSVTDSDGNTTTAERKVTVRSNEKPIITGADAVIIKAYDNFNETLGVTANDKEDGHLTSKINIEGNVDSTTEGVYTLIYSVSDSDGNHSSVRRRVKVRSNHKPEIIGASEVNLKVGNTFDPLEGILARDGEDGIITKNISVINNLDNLKVGEYILGYSITDSDGNTTTAERKVIVESNEKPIISGIKNKVIKIGDEFNPLEGVIASDFEDKDLTNKILVTGSVNNNAVGDYKLTYSVTDSDGNIITNERVITVRTNEKPKILGVEDTIIKVRNNFDNTSLAILAMDEEDGDITNLVSIKGKVDNNTEGEYILVYSVTDSDGNTTTVERKVTVRSNEKPVINGVKNYVIKIGDTFNPLEKVTAFDKEDLDLTDKIKIEGNIDTSSIGIYELIYSVIDSDSNKVSKSSLITVKSNEKPNFLNIKNISIKQGDIFNPYNEGFIVLDKEDGDISHKTKIEGKVDSSKIGDYNLIYSVEDSDGNVVKAIRKITVRSNTIPNIEGVENKVIKIGESFNAIEDISANDTEDGDLTSSIKIDGTVDNNKVGVYKLIYYVTDSDKNTVRKTREVIVKSNDKPIITGTEDLSIKARDNFNYYLGVEALDTEDGHLTDKIELEGEVNTNLIGEYPIIYKVKDSDENKTTAKRIITVRSNEKPIIQGISNLELKVNEIFNPLQGVNATDKEDGDLTNSIEIDGNVNINKSGLYTLIYKVEDKDNNITKAIRKVLVKSNEKPIILGAKDITMKQYERFNYNIGIKAIDKEDGDLTKNIKIEGEVDSSNVGEYILTYSIIDKDGNKTSNNIKVTVISNESPIIEENEKIILKAGDKFNYLYGIKATDKEDGDISNLLKITGEVDTNKLGVYKVNYSVLDKDGNKSTFTRKVLVRSNEKPKIYGNENINLTLGESFNNMEGIVVNDKEDGDLTKKVIVKGEINTNKLGAYDLIYSVTDNDGNDTVATRRITVKAINNIEILGVNNIEIPYGEPFDVMKGIKAIDSQNNDLTSSIIIEGNVDVNKLGSYTLIYSIKNHNGEELKFFREIIVKDKEDFKKLSPEFEPIITEIIPKKFNIHRKKSSIEEKENLEKIIENILLPEPQPNILKEELKEELKESKNEQFIKNYKGKTLPPEDTKPLPLWLFGIISITLGRKIRKKDE